MTAWLLTVALSVVAHQSARESPMPRADQGARIRGVVVSDDASRTPVRHALVRLSGPSSAGMITGDDGAFAFGDLEPGRYEMTASKPGFGESAFGARPGRDIGTPIALAAGQQMSALDIRLARGGVITGTVTGADGGPLAYATVMASRIVTKADGSRRLASEGAAESLDDGSYRIYGLPNGTFIVSAEARVKNDITGCAPAYFGTGTSAADAATLAVRSGDERRGIDIAMRAAPFAAIRGVVLDAEGRPASGIKVVLDIAGGMTTEGEGIGSQSVSTIADGSFVFPKVCAGSYVASTGNAGTDLSSSQVPALGARAEVTVGGRDISGLTLTFRPPPTANGRATGSNLTSPDTLGTAHGLVTDASGAASSDFLIVVFSADRTQWPTRSNDARVIAPDTNGEWSAPGLPPGGYRVAAIKDWMSQNRVTPELLEQLVATSATMMIESGNVTSLNLRVGGG